MKKFFAIIIVSIMLFGLASFAFAQGRELEVNYPEIGGERPRKDTTPVTEYFKYIFNFLIWISGLIALFVLIQAGLEYITSVGNPEGINNAKSKIGAALLGLLILFGSYLILITINPDLVVFNLPRLRPIISELPAGVLVCREKVRTESGEDAVLKAWELVLEYRLYSPSEEREEEIKENLNIMLDKISLDCYVISGAEDIRTDFDNKIEYVYFIPHIETEGTEITRIVEYGAVAYEDGSFKGESQVLAENLINPEGTADTYVEPMTIGASSIKPFALVYRPDPNWEVILYQEYNENIGVEGLTPVYVNITSSPECVTSWNQGKSSEWWCEVSLSPPPKSMRTEGDLLAIFLTPDGRSEVFFSESDANLEDNLNIVDWVDCKDYDSSIEETCTKWVGGSFGGAYVSYDCCAEVAATSLMVISAKSY